MTTRMVRPKMGATPADCRHGPPALETSTISVPDLLIQVLFH
jgi:hypothetical protein